jgi:predicted esterase
MDARIRMIAGEQDTTVPVEWSQDYVDILTARGVDATIRVEPGLGHNILFTRQVFAGLQALLEEFNATAGR